MESPAPEEAADGRASFSQMPTLLFIRGLGLVGVAVLLFAGLHYYLGVRLLRDAGVSESAGALGWSALTLLFFTLPCGFIFSRIAPRPLALVVQWVGHVWLGTFGVLLPVTATVDLVSAVLRLSSDVWGPRKALLIAAIALPALVVGFVTARGKARIEKVRVRIADLPAAFDGLRIVQVSDVHIGETLGRRFLARMVEQVNALSPDVVAITGDLVDGTVRELRDQMTPLAQLQAKRGVYYVTGNHEYYHGGPAWEAEVRRLGLTVLHNEHKLLAEGEGQLAIAGLPDFDAGHFGAGDAPDPALALRDIPSKVPRVLLAHQPRSARLLRGHRVDLQLSGHTHGGQMFPFMFFVRFQQPVVSGLHTLSGVQVYTSRGTGYWGPPFRLGPRPEITELTLVR